MKKIREIKNLLPIIICIGFVPLIVRMKEYYSHLSQYAWFPDTSEVQVDFFLVYKSYAIILTGIVMMLLFLFDFRKKQFRRNLKFEKWYYCIIVMAVLTFLSGLLSQHSYFAFSGSYAVFESVWVLLSYLVICVYCSKYVQNEGQIYQIMNFAGVGVLIIGLINLLQACGSDFFKTTIGKKMITPRYYWPHLDNISFTFDPNTVYSTLYNPDYVGFYVSLLCPVFVVLLIKSNKKWMKLFYGLLTTLLLISIVYAKALSGILGFAAGIIIGIGVLCTRNKKTFFALITGAIVACFAGILLCVNTSLGDKLYTVFVGTFFDKDNFAIKSIETTDEDIIFNINGNEMHLSYYMDDETQSVYVVAEDENGIGLELISTGENGLSYQVTDEKYLNCLITPIYLDDYLSLQVDLDGHEWMFTNQLDDGGYYYYNRLGKFDKMTKVEQARVFNNDAFQNRGIIWDHVFPLLPKSIVIGTGANTFTLNYPQTDYVYKEYMGGQFTYDVKAHNWYLQYWLENGLLALLALLTMYVIYLIQAIKIIRNADMKKTLSMICCAVFMGLNGYMVIAMANDSNVNTAPVFWAMLGIGFAVNQMAKKDMQVNV